MLNVIMLIVIIVSFVMLNAVILYCYMLSVIIRDAIVLSVVAPNRENENYAKVCLREENIHGLCYKTFYNNK
jgi:hypothetical protein